MTTTTQEDVDGWSKARITLNGAGELYLRGSSLRSFTHVVLHHLNPAEQAFFLRAFDFRSKLHTPRFRVYAYYSAEGLSRIFLQTEFINYEDDKRLWSEIDKKASELGAIVAEMDNGIDADDETRRYRHVEVLWRIDDHTTGDALALRDRVEKETSDLFKRAGNSVY